MSHENPSQYAWHFTTKSQETSGRTRKRTSTFQNCQKNPSQSLYIFPYIPISHDNLSEPNMKYTYLHFPQESKKYIDKVMVWSLFFLLGVKLSSNLFLDSEKDGFPGSSSLVLNSHELSSSSPRLGKTCGISCGISWEFSWLLDLLNWDVLLLVLLLVLPWLGNNGNIYGKKYGTIFVVLPPCFTHVTNFHGFGWIRLFWFWNWDVPLLVREKMEPYWKKYETSDGICAWFFQIFWNVLPPLMLPCFPLSRKNNKEKHLNSKTRTNKFIQNHENSHTNCHMFFP